METAGYRVERHSAHFAPNARDVDFLPVVGQHRDWIALTHDSRQRYNPDERDAVMRSGVALFIHVGQLKHSELAASFVMAAPRLIRFRDKYDPPFIAKVYRPEKKTAFVTVPGKVAMSLTLHDWTESQRGL